MTDKEFEQKADDVVSVTGPQAEVDTAIRSLTNALRVSFAILKIIMIVLVMLFFASGIFRVQPNEQALVLRFGRIRGIGQARLLGPGLQWAFPEPIEEIVRIVVKKKQTLPIDSFWYYEREEDKLKRRKSRIRGPLRLPRDGYCLTRSDNIVGVGGGSSDYNIVHAKWQLTYTIDNPERFFKNIYYKAPAPGQDFSDVVSETLDPLLKAMAEDAIATTMVNYSIDEAIVSESKIPIDVAKLLQEKLDRIDSGIKIDSMQISEKITWPRQVDAAFQASNKASQERKKLISEAGAYAEKMLNETAGPDAQEILAVLKSPGTSDQEKKRLLSQLTGACQEKVSLARAYRTRTVATARANAEYLQTLLPEYRKRPKLVLQKIYQDALEEVLNNAEEKLFIQPSIGGKPKELRIMINRDQTLRKSTPKQTR
jgi:membrane protease subunit HflK